METVRFYRNHKDPVEMAKRSIQRKAAILKKASGESSVYDTPVARQADLNIRKRERTDTRNHQAGQSGNNTCKAKHSFRADLIHAIVNRDQNQCAGKNADGSRCENRRWLDFHHVIPRAKGGKDTIENLVTLCRGHHQMRHHQPGSGFSGRKSIIAAQVL
jgi:hypothetical protein